MVAAAARAACRSSPWTLRLEGASSDPCVWLDAVEVWSGNHPFYQGKTETVVRDNGPLARFRRRYAGLVSYNEIPGGEMHVGGDDSADDEDEESEPEHVPLSKARRGGSKAQKPKKAKGKK